MEPDTVNAHDENDSFLTDSVYMDDGVTSPGEREHPSETNGSSIPATPSITAEETQELQKQLNDQLETCMSNYRSQVKQFFKEFVIFHQESNQVVESWKAPFENQLAEQNRLDAVESDVEQTMKSIPWMMNPNLFRDIE